MNNNRFPDVSFYQGAIGFDIMKSKTEYIILRSSQRLWLDPQFVRSRNECGRVGLPFGVYHFYDDRDSPGKQADFVASILAGSPQPLEIFCDWEKTYGGPYAGLPNVVAFMQRLEQLTGKQVDFYTGYWWFVENSNAAANASQYNYLKGEKLWLAAYNETHTPTGGVGLRIPKPWTKVNIHQYGTPAIGKSYGAVDSLEIDMNERLDDFKTGNVPVSSPKTIVDGIVMPDDGNNTSIPTGDKMYQMTTISGGTRIRSDHNVYAGVLTSVGQNITVSGSEIWTASADGNNVKAGDRWLKITYAGVTGWMALTHMGIAICKDFKFANPIPIPIPKPPEKMKIVSLTVVTKYSDGSSETEDFYPQ